MKNRKTFIRIIDYVNNVAKQMAAIQGISKELLIERAIQYYAENNFKHIPHIAHAFDVENCSMVEVRGQVRCV